MRTPPGSRLPRIAQTLLLLRDPLALMRRLHAGEHDAFTARVVGAPPIAYLADPDLVHELFRHDEGAGLAGEARRPYFAPLVGESSLLVLDGDRWLEHRKLIGPPLHGRRITDFRSRIAEIAAAEVDSWPTGEAVELRPRMQRITLEVILRVVFGLDEGATKQRLREMLPRLIEQGQWLVWAPARVRDPLIAALQRRPWLRRLVPAGSTLDVLEEVDEILFAEIRERRGAEDLEQRTDVLSLLLQAEPEGGEPLSDGELRDELVTLLEAGHETTATALAWAFERLTRNPQALRRLREELDGDGSERDYLEAVVKETLRSRPVVIDVIRLLREPLTLGGYEIPAGWLVGPATTLIHNLPEHFPDPERFRPERFLGEGAPYRAWFPFGGGRRRCVGSHLAQLEMAVTIEEVLRRFDVAAPDPEPETARTQHVTLVPAKGATVVLAERAGGGRQPAAAAAAAAGDVRGA